MVMIMATTRTPTQNDNSAHYDKYGDDDDNHVDGDDDGADDEGITLRFCAPVPPTMQLTMMMHRNTMLVFMCAPDVIPNSQSLANHSAEVLQHSPTDSLTNALCAG